MGNRRVWKWRNRRRFRHHHNFSAGAGLSNGPSRFPAAGQAARISQAGSGIRLVSERVGRVHDDFAPAEFQTRWRRSVLAAAPELLHRRGGGRAMLGASACDGGCGVFGNRELNAARFHLRIR